MKTKYVKILKSIVSVFLMAMLLSTLFAVQLPTKVKAGTVVAHPRPGVDDVASTTYQVWVDGNPVDCVDYKGITYCNFSFSGSVSVKVKASGTITSYSMKPARLAVPATTSGSELTFTLSNPQKFIVKINSLNDLHIYGNPMEASTPGPNDSNVVNVMNYAGIDNTGTNLCTTAIQNAINAVAASGGTKTICYVPAGKYKIGTIFVKSNVNLYLASGAVLEGSKNPEDYPSFGPPTSPSGSTYHSSALVYLANNDSNLSKVTNAKLTGRGTITGWGDYLKHNTTVKSVLVSVRGDNCEVSGNVHRDACEWNTWILGSTYTLVKDLKILNRHDETWYDGIDIDTSRNITVEDCIIRTGDDGICLKRTGFYGHTGDVTDIVVKNCILNSGKATALRIGKEAFIDGTVKRVLFEDIDILYGYRDGFRSDMDFGTVEDVTLRRVTSADSMRLWGGNRNIVFEDCSASEETEVKGDSTRATSGIKFVNFKYLGTLRTTLSDANITVGTNASGVSITTSIIDEYFDNGTVGSAPSGWTTTLGTAGSVTVQAKPTALDKSMKVSKSSGSADSCVASKTFSTSQSGIITVEAEVMSESTSGFKCAPYISDSSGNKVISVALKDGYIAVYDGTTLTNIQSFSSNKWYRLKIVLNTDTDKFDLYVDDVLKKSQANFRTAASNISKIEWSIGSGYSGNVYANDVIVYK